MAYADKINFPFKVLIADGGSDESVTTILGNKSAYPNVDYEYIRYPYDASPTDYYVKVLDALNRVETPFVVLADNDDFFVVDGLLRSIEFLKLHPDFSSCRGVIAGFKIQPHSSDGELSNVYGRDVSFVRQVYPEQSTLEETAAGRVRNYCAHYRATWYDVFRTEQTQESFRILRDVDTQDLILSQHIPMLLGAIAGKIQVDNYVYLFRQLEGVSSVDKTETKEKADLFDRMLLDTWSADFKGFLDVISNAIAEKDSISKDEAARQVRSCYRQLMTPGLVQNLMGSIPRSRSIRMAEKFHSLTRPARTVARKLSGRGSAGAIANGSQQFIPASRLAATDQDFRSIYEFLANPPPSIRASTEHPSAHSREEVAI
jgi:glycosyltransferase domain-containing protein